MWGSNEAVEMQTLLLFELKALLLRPEESAKEPGRTFDTYTRFLRERFPQLPPAPLCELEGAPFSETLREFHRLLSSRLEREDLFQHSDLVIHLQYKERHRPTAISFTGYADELRRVVRSFARAQDKSAGRVRKEIEEITDFSMKDARIQQPDERPAEAWLMLERGNAARPHLFASEELRTVLSRVTATANWLDSGAPVSDVPIDDPDMRVRVGVQMLRLLPRRDVDLVEVGGTLSGSPKPFILRASHAARCAAIVAEGAAPTPFDQTAEIRGIDLDRGTVALGKRPRITCFVPSDILGTDIREVGVSARVRGLFYTPPLSPPFVIAESIEVLGFEASDA
jgi:hypothetical protein